MSLACVAVAPLPAAAAAACAAALDPWCTVVATSIDADDGRVTLTGWLAAAAVPDRPTLAAIATALAVAAAMAGIDPPALTVRAVGDDWLAANREQFRPFRLGRFFIQGADAAEPPPPGLLPLTVDAGLAFGSGRHASTAGCLLALTLRGVAGPRPSLLDVGTGSGVLAIAAAKLWRAKVLATDIDAAAVAVASANVRRNGVADRVRLLVADGARHPAITAAAPYDLIVANILARPLIRLAPALAALGGAGTRLVLAGFVAADAARVAAAYAPHGYRRRRRIDGDGWTTLVLARRR